MNETHKGPVFTEIVLEIFKLGGLLISEGDRMGAEFGATSARWKVLGALALSRQAQTVSQIAKRMGLSRQAVQRLVDVLHKDGFLLFRENPDHKRAKLIDLSERGQATYSKLEKTQVEWADQCSRTITKEELETTLSVLRRIASAIDS